MRLIALLAALVLGGCAPAPHVSTEVTTFHNLVDVPRGKTFVMLPGKDQEGSLEWRTYANLVAGRLERLGLVRTHELTKETDLAVYVRYAIDSGRTSVSSAPVFGQTGGGTTATTTGYIGRTPISGSTYTAPTFGVTGYVPVESTTFTRGVKITIYDVKRSLDDGKAAAVYEATGISSGATGNLNLIMPYILDGMMEGWPGVPGTTVVKNIKVSG